MRYKGSTGKQKRYAYFLMNEGMSRAECARQAGYSKTMVDNPKQIEQSNGFALAMATVAGQTGKTYLKMLYELESRDMTSENTQTILKAVDILSNAWTRFLPKQKTTQDGDLSNIFDNVIDVSSTDVNHDTDINVVATTQGPEVVNEGLDKVHNMLPIDELNKTT